MIFGNLYFSQYLAEVLSYHPALGNRFLGLYPPWAWITWIAKYYTFDLSSLEPAIEITFYSSTALVFAALLFVSKRIPKQLAELHGSARWADEEDVIKSGLLSKFTQEHDGVCVGGWKLRGLRSKEVVCLRHDGPEHVLAFAPSRSGKGIGLVLPTLLSWKHSALILDIKGENWAMTSGWRKKSANNVVMKFEPAAADGSSVAFNPLEEIRFGTVFEVSDVQNIVSIIVDPEGKEELDHWSRTASAMLVGVIIHCLYKETLNHRCANINTIINALSDPYKSCLELFEEMKNNQHDKPDIRIIVSQCAQEMLSKSESERSSIHSTALSYLSLYRDPIIARNTKRSDFKLENLMNHERPVSLYLVINPSDNQRLKPLIRLFIAQTLAKISQVSRPETGLAGNYKHRLLFLLDEFPTLGKMTFLETSLAYIAGYGVKAYLITQDITQLRRYYGKSDAIISNCHVRIAFAPNRDETAAMLSSMIGDSTVLQNTVSVTKNSSGLSTSRTETTQSFKRRLLTTSECLRLKGLRRNSKGEVIQGGDSLIFVSGIPPILGRQILYFQIPQLLERSKIKAPLRSDPLIPELAGLGYEIDDSLR